MNDRARRASKNVYLCLPVSKIPHGVMAFLGAEKRRLRHANVLTYACLTRCDAMDTLAMSGSEIPTRRKG